MELLAGEHVVFSGHPSWRSILGFYLKGLVLAVLVGAIGYFAIGVGVAIGIGIGVVVLVALVGLLMRIGTTYTITNRRLEIRRGLLSRHVQEAQLERVQNLDVNQSLLERILRVGTVNFDTAGSGDADFAFNGIAHPEGVVRAVNDTQREAAAAAPAPPPATSGEVPPPAPASGGV